LSERKAEKDTEPVIEKKTKEPKKAKTKDIKMDVQSEEIIEEEEVIPDAIKVDLEVKKAPIKKKPRKEEE